MSGEEVSALKRYLAFAHSYCEDTANSFKERVEESKDDTLREYNKNLMDKWKSDADEVLTFTSKLPNPWK